VAFILLTLVTSSRVHYACSAYCTIDLWSLKVDARQALDQELVLAQVHVAVAYLLNVIALVTLDCFKEGVHQIKLALEITIPTYHAESLFNNEDGVVTLPLLDGFELDAETVEHIADICTCVFSRAIMVLVGIKSEDKCVLTVVLTLVEKTAQLALILQLSATDTCWKRKVFDHIFALFDLIVVKLLRYLNEHAWLCCHGFDLFIIQVLLVPHVINVHKA
jgi:hypothetical protein